jgi:hypothetical protein
MNTLFLNWLEKYSEVFLKIIVQTNNIVLQNSFSANNLNKQILCGVFLNCLINDIMTNQTLHDNLEKEKINKNHYSET